MAETRVFTDGTSLSELASLVGVFAGEDAMMVKLVVDTASGWIAAGAGMHFDEEQELLARGSRQEDLWGLNVYFDRPAGHPRRVVLESMINLRPPQHSSRIVEDPVIREAIMVVLESEVEGW